MFPAKVLADLSSVHARPSKKPSAYEEHKSNLKKLFLQRQKQMQEKRIKASENINASQSVVIKIYFKVENLNIN